MEVIKIDNVRNVTYRTNNGYSSNAFVCSLYLKTFFDQELLAKYKCDYILKTDGNKKYIEFPEDDLHSSLDCVAAPEWSICMVTEQIPYKGKYIITATFNIYKQIRALGNKQYFDTKIVEIL